MKRTLYLNCFAGISGDMMLGLLLDLLDEEDLASRLKGLALEGWDVTVQRGMKSSLAGVDVKVLSDEGHVHRGLSDVLSIIEKSDLSPAVAERAAEGFRLLAQAEGAIHGLEPDSVHFHEVGAVDALVDIIGAVTLMEALAPDEVVASAVNVGSGTVRCAHGELPVPAPATLKLLEGVPIYSQGQPMERTTPTGAVLLRLFVDRYGPIPAGVVVKSGYGLGDRDSDLPNLLQGVLLAETDLFCAPPGQGHAAGGDHDHHGHSHPHDHDHPHDARHPHGHGHSHGHPHPHDESHGIKPQGAGHDHDSSCEGGLKDCGADSHCQG